MHYSCVSIPPALAYSPDLAVLLSKLLKGSIYFIIVLIHSLILSPDHPEDIRDATHTPKQEGQHLSLIFGSVFSGNVHQQHICVADGLYA